MNKETIIVATLAAISAGVNSYLGGWDVPLRILIFLICVDYITGVLAAWKRKQLNSEVMFWGGIRKASLMVVIAIAVMLDQLIGSEAPVFRMIALYFYIAREGLSVIENIGLFGVQFPAQMQQFLEQLKRQSESSPVPKTLQAIDMPLGKPVTAQDSEANKAEAVQNESEGSGI